MQKKIDNYISRIAGPIIESEFSSGKVIILMGARQTGKTTLVRHILRGKKTACLNFDIILDRKRFLAASELEPSEAMRVFGEPEFFIIDEVQRLPQAAGVIKGWYDSGLPVTFLLLGSSNIQMADRAAESLAGRNKKIILPPLTFWEIIRSRPWSRGFTAGQIKDKFADTLEAMLIDCMIYGHYPEAVTTGDKRSYLQNLSSDIMMRDLLQLGLIRSPDSIQKILMLLAHQTGSEVSVNELACASGLARPTVERYLALLEQSFIIFKLPAFSSNPRKEISKSQKYYFWDTGIRDAVLGAFSENMMRPDIGALWENWVIAEFARQNALSGFQGRLYFWRSRSGSEVDLIYKKDDQLLAFEIKWNPKKKPGMAFSEAYNTEINVIHRKNPLFFIDDF